VACSRVKKKERKKGRKKEKRKKERKKEGRKKKGRKKERKKERKNTEFSDDTYMVCNIISQFFNGFHLQQFINLIILGERIFV